MNQVASFDYFDLGDPIDKMLKLEKSEPYSTQFEAIGYGSSYFLNNLGTILLSFVAYASVL